MPGVKRLHAAAWRRELAARASQPKQLTPYMKRMDRLSNRIFGQVSRPTDVESMRVVHNFSIEPMYNKMRWNTTYYPPHPMFHYLCKLLRMVGLYRDEHLDWNDEIARRRAKRGKVPPKIGEGKRALVKKGAI